jgi:hypothetical protein
LYTLYLTDSISGTVTNNYAIYQASPGASNYFSGHTAIRSANVSQLVSLAVDGGSAAAGSTGVIIQNVACSSDAASTCYGLRINDINGGSGDMGSNAYALQIYNVTQPAVGGAYGVHVTMPSALNVVGLYVYQQQGFGLQIMGGAHAYIEGDVVAAAASAFYLGAQGTDGSWRFIRVGNNLQAQRLEASVWVTKQTISA